ncbi:LPS export ABC transporter periplasmic protein LptC [Pseudodesulfovibrio pelocollis]|uniref:LPS export ABC transporter periplasmic protein LptC n=1 Tax=Pseudodesulfovibrio pelocollis TaxID=3051432 RepID=UPI00255ACCA5|nr:LPS export ABC transporter periplasmic protein LptC [Pseudodesulfovibrio sp. SB368]
MKGRPGLLLVTIFLVGLLAGIVIKAAFFTEEIVEPTAVQPVSGKSRTQLLDEADITAEDIELVQGRLGAMTWKLLATEARYNQERKLVGVTRPQLSAYFGEERQEVYVKADRGEVDQPNDNLTLYDNVTGRFGVMALDAGHLDYVGAIDKVYLKGGVTVRRPDMTLTAVAVEIDLVSLELKAAGGVEALFAPKGFDASPFQGQGRE